MKNYILILLLILTGCGSVQLSTINHKPTKFVVLEVPSIVKIDTLSYTRLSWKMRNSFTFRWNYAKFASNQPFSFYSSALFARFWNPFNSFDMYWNRHNFWYEWAFGYPYFNYQRPRYYMYEQPRNVAVMKGRRGGIRKVREDKVNIVANRLRNEVRLNNNKSWNSKNKFVPRKNPNNNFNSKITPRENPRQDIKQSRSLVNSTKISMRTQVKK